MNVFRRMVADRRRGACWWALGTFVGVATTVALWPSIKGNSDVERLVDDLPASVQAIIGSQEGISLGSAAGYLQARVFSTVLPVLLVVYAIGLGAEAVASAEENGTLQLVVTAPRSRRRIALERLAAATVLGLGPAAVALVTVVVLGAPVGLLDELSVPRVALSIGAVSALALFHGCVAFAVGAATGRRGAAVGVASAVAAGGYLLNAVAASSSSLGGLRDASPWWWLLERNLLLQSAEPRTFVLPVVLGAIVSWVGVEVFCRRDLHLP